MPLLYSNGERVIFFTKGRNSIRIIYIIININIRKFNKLFRETKKISKSTFVIVYQTITTRGITTRITKKKFQSNKLFNLAFNIAIRFRYTCNILKLLNRKRKFMFKKVSSFTNLTKKILTIKESNHNQHRPYQISYSNHQV